MEEKKNIYEKLSEIQNELKAPKGQRNTFGNYNYRSCEDILEAVKPILKKHKATLVLSDELIVVGENTPITYQTREFSKEEKEWIDKNNVIGFQRYYIKATASLYDFESSDSIINNAYAREEETKKGMDGSQITGTASSYARKYALDGLFNIDDTKDADTDEYGKQTKVEEKEESKKVSLTTDKQKEMIKDLYSTEEIKEQLELLKRSKLSELTIQEASSLIAKRKGEK